jgi:tetratricopeptide (TPR) repeat protein
MKHKKIRAQVRTFIVCAAVFCFISCATKERIAVNQLDTPGHHTYTGLKLLDLGKYSDARREFKMATQLDAKYSKAFTGMALINICNGKLDAAAYNLAEGLKNAESDDEKLFAYVAGIRYHTSNKSDPRWLEAAKNQFDEAVLIDYKYSPAYYYMGLAYREALEFNRAIQMFSTVIKLKTDHIDDATNQISFLQKVQKAKPTTLIGKKIALTESLTRAETAALFMEELKLKDLYNKYAPKPPDKPAKETEPVAQEMKETGPITDTKAAGQVFTETFPVEPPPMKIWAKDIMEHPLLKHIEGVLEAGVKGLENDPKGNFKPNEVISRGEFAIIVEDILIRVTGEKDIAARYVNSKALFPDVPAEMPYFNAIISVTSRGIMEAKNTKTGEFAPLKPLSGVEALQAIRKLKEELKIN